MRALILRRNTLAFLFAFSTGSLLLAIAEEPAAVPSLAGTWIWTWKGPDGQTHRHTLEVEGTGNKLAAREIFDDDRPVRVTPITLEGTALTFVIQRDGRTAEYKGKLADPDHVSGTVIVTTNGQAVEHVWNAERKKGNPR